MKKLLLLSLLPVLILVNYSPLVFSKIGIISSTKPFFYNYKVQAKTLVDYFTSLNSDVLIIGTTNSLSSPDKNGYMKYYVFDKTSFQYYPVLIYMNTKDPLKPFAQIVLYSVSEPGALNELRILNMDLGIVEKFLIKRRFEQIVIKPLENKGITPSSTF